MRYFFTKNHTQNVVERLVELLKQIKPTFLKGESLTLKNLWIFTFRGVIEVFYKKHDS